MHSELEKDFSARMKNKAALGPACHMAHTFSFTCIHIALLLQVEQLLSWCDDYLKPGTAGGSSVEAQFIALQQELAARGADVSKVALAWTDGFRGLKASKGDST